ncbi:MAG: hypothetical protein ACR2ID_06440 [Chthoniobacterales bacterium]
MPLPALPVTADELEALKGDYDDKKVAATDGNRAARAAVRPAANALIDALRKVALYVEIVATDDSFVLNTGFLPASTNRTQTPLQQGASAGGENAADGRAEAADQRATQREGIRRSH